jgi:hypothetical protein
VAAARLAKQLRSAMSYVRGILGGSTSIDEVSRMLAPRLRRLAELVA